MLFFVRGVNFTDFCLKSTILHHFLHFEKGFSSCFFHFLLFYRPFLFLCFYLLSTPKNVSFDI